MKGMRTHGQHSSRMPPSWDDARARARMSLFFTDISIQHSLRASRRPGATRSDGWGMRGRGTTTDGQNMIKTRHNLTTHTFSGLDHRVTSPAPRRCGVGVRSFLLLSFELGPADEHVQSVDKKGPNGGRRKAHPPTTHTHPHMTPTKKHAVFWASCRRIVASVLGAATGFQQGLADTVAVDKQGNFWHTDAIADNHHRKPHGV